MPHPCPPSRPVRPAPTAPCLIISAMLVAASFPMIPEGIPVLGGDGAMTVPLGDFRGSRDLVGRGEGDPHGEDVRERGALGRCCGQSSARHSSNGLLE